MTAVLVHVTKKWLGRLKSLNVLAIKDFTENLENMILQSSLARFTLCLIKWMEYKIKRGFTQKMIYTE